MTYFYDLSELNWEFFGFYDWIDAYNLEFYFVVYTQNLAIVSYLLTFPFLRGEKLCVGCFISCHESRRLQ
ncbi:TPA: hypothetical protein RUZ56_003103 [Vibrio cholerae]|nr:hypothetical protein [Vibrio cholerae]ELJ8516479.1 hypothetical protein [Vibrio cholerae]PNM49388.1 hypothetical protein AL535_007455 [Vibrio cholerae]TQO83195.1 hypothetical protein FLM10_13045 [Vibrio cholerae]TQP51859.1 hypothetical protein FLL90_04905 [Vibrio cholerae]TQP84357.1 hypothetical protein FLL89_05345 [Vibrio cholerae]